MEYEEMDEEFEKLRYRWYHDTDVLFQLIANLKYREGIFLRGATKSHKSVAHRCLKMNMIQYFMLNVERYHFLEEPLNLYSSLATVPNMPMFSFVIEEKQEQMRDFNKGFQDYATGYDFLLDLDNPDLELAYATATKVKRVFDEKQIPYSLIFSGKKGFHFRISYDHFPQWIKDLKWQEIADTFKLFAENFKMINNFVDIDTSIFDLRRIAKLPYSIVYPYYFVALPLSDAQFNDFSLKEMSLPYLINKTDKLHKRGLLTRPGTPDNFGKLIKEYTEER